MPTPNIEAIAAALDKRAHAHEIGNLPGIRKKLKRLKRRPGSSIFSYHTTFDDYAYHHGGRPELQFNIGRDGTNGAVELRHGVAFSLELSQTLPTIDVLVPKIKLFNDYLQLNAEQLSDMLMWHYDGERSEDYAPTAIPPDLVRSGVFIFLGKRGPAKNVDYDSILKDFDRLLPLYRYVESRGKVQPVVDTSKPKFKFKAGCVSKTNRAKASYAEKELDLDLRHNELQKSLFERLAKQFGPSNVGTEIPTGVGTLIDVVVKSGNEFWYYEIKTALTARGCLREALGQLLEYSYWPGTTKPTKLVVVGEAPATADDDEYVSRLRKEFSLPISYLQVKLKG